MHSISKKSLMILAVLILSMSFVLTRADFPQAMAADGGNWQDLGRQVLAQNDGWAAAEGGTTGGAKATPARISTVTNRKQLVQALGSNNTGADATPKIIFIKGIINGNEDDTGKPLTCQDYATNGYTLESYLKTYDPAVFGRTKVPSGPLEDARFASFLKQAARIQIHIPSNTTIIGDQAGARVIGTNFVVAHLIGINNPPVEDIVFKYAPVKNVIIRNIQFENAFDCFPQWDATDGANGNWNSWYDNMSIISGSNHVWIDHNSFTDGDKPDSQQPTHFGREYEQHDGELDITKGADLITVSWNRFSNHNKIMLIGSTDKPTFDVDKLRVTVHHNTFENSIQRTPRVRYGQVHIYNNYNNETDNPSLQYVLGVGILSKIFAQNNYYTLPTSKAVGKVIIKAYKGTVIHTEGDIVDKKPTDLLAAYNAAHDTTPLAGDVGWTPTFHGPVDPTQCVPSLVPRNAGVTRTFTVLQDSRANFSPSSCPTV